MSKTTSNAGGPGRPDRHAGQWQLWGKKAGLVGDRAARRAQRKRTARDAP